MQRTIPSRSPAPARPSPLRRWHLRPALFCALAAVLCSGPLAPSAPPPPASAYRWEKAAGDHLSLIGPSGVVWRFNFSPRLDKPYFHPLQTADGRPLTWVSPPDHAWHYGLWHSWKFINALNYWEPNKKTGRPDGTTAIVASDIRRADGRGAEVELRLAYHPADRPQEIVMEERLTVTIDLPDAQGSYRLLWRQETWARQAVLLDRTPIPGDPKGVAHGGYGGLSFRGHQDLRQVTMTNSDGVTDDAANRRPGRWMMLDGTVGGRPAAVTMFDHPANPRHPTPWYLVRRELKTGPFWYINAGIVHDRALPLAAGATLLRTYLIRIDGQRPTAAALDEEFARFAKTVPAPLASAPPPSR